MQLSLRSVLVVTLSVPLLSGLASANGKSRVDIDAACAGLAKDGMPQYKTADMSKFKAPSPDTAKYPYILPVVFHVINHKGGAFSLGGFPISERELGDELENARKAFHQCGVEVTAQAAYYWDGPSFLNVLSRSATDEHELGKTERCALAPTFKDTVMNVYFVGCNSASHSMASYWYTAGEEGDSRYIGATSLVCDFDRSGPGGSARYFVVPHEIGHVVMDTGHVMGPVPNLMQDSRDLLSYTMTPEQCEAMKNSPLVHQR